MGPRPDLPPYPNGWYVFGTSEELAPGRLLGRKFMGEQVVVFRSNTGKAYAVEAYCPHLGAHLGYGGSVQGDLLQCPFHGFQFNGMGECVRTGYGVEALPKQN
jgi:phenylpropionate dioxygenase-like ring-hydroxylating dioxygenase large terminal subunit